MPLFKQVLVTDLQSDFNGQLVDIRTEDGRITAIGQQLEARPDEVVHQMEGVRISPGFLDIGPYLGDPGHEEREDLESLALAARRGGYTSVAPLPDANPVRHDKSGISFLTKNAHGLGINILPLGAVSQDLAGKDITEMMDMQRAGAVAFTDAPKSIEAAGLMSRALHYVKAFDGLVINTPYDRSLSPNGQLHEGEVSTRLGLPGIPAISEQLMLHRDLELLAYADSRLLVHLLSSRQGVEMVKSARERGLRLTASVAMLNLQFTDQIMSEFDPNYKVLPPLRQATDREALVQGLKDGTIDCIVSNHQAHEPEQKALEFAHTDFGATALQSCLAQAITTLEGALEVDKISALFSHGPRQALGLPVQSLMEEMPAEFTFFQTEQKKVFQQHPDTQKGRNNGMVGQELKGGPVATFQGGVLRYCTA